MKFNALVPVKSLTDAKSRLTKEYSFNERKQLVLSMLTHLITVLQKCNEIAQITLVTPDEEVKKHVLDYSVNVLFEEKHGLNPALTAAAQRENMNFGLLTIFADLPFLTTHDIHQLVLKSVSHDVVLAPSKDNGTNAILLKKPLLLPYLFGKNSFKKYSESAKKTELKIFSYTSKTIAFDVDTVDDVKLLKTIQSTKNSTM